MWIFEGHLGAYVMSIKQDLIDISRDALAESRIDHDMTSVWHPQTWTLRKVETTNHMLQFFQVRWSFSLISRGGTNEEEVRARLMGRGWKLCIKRAT